MLNQADGIEVTLPCGVYVVTQATTIILPRGTHLVFFPNDENPSVSDANLIESSPEPGQSFLTPDAEKAARWLENNTWEGGVCILTSANGPAREIRNDSGSESGSGSGAGCGSQGDFD